MDQVQQIEQLFSDTSGPCPDCGISRTDFEDDALSATANHMISHHGWQVLHVGQQSRTSSDGDLVQRTTSCLVSQESKRRNAGLARPSARPNRD